MADGPPALCAWPKPYATEGLNPRQVCYSHVRASPWAGAAREAHTVLRFAEDLYDHLPALVVFLQVHVARVRGRRRVRVRVRARVRVGVGVRVRVRPCILERELSPLQAAGGDVVDEQRLPRKQDLSE